jgi:2-polyprenyl-6-methoxyphenol hydroxylase-like FAD-dependent oxidoreductase
LTKRIGIIGAGTGGLHLGLRLQQLGIQATIIPDRRAAEYRESRLQNTVAHHSVTVARETQMGVNH